jgi:multiple sugar transport system substrate-binding protein
MFQSAKERKVMLRMNKKVVLAVAAAVLTIATPAVTTTQAHAAGTTINYWLWDDRQQPAYQACADLFQKNTGTTVKITQSGWNDYWTAVNTSLATGDGKIDVFTDHLAYYQTFLNAKQIVDISAGVKAAGVNTSIYQAGLYDLWSKNGGQYGLPKDFDTISLAYDSKAASKAGYTAALVNKLTWNPTNGGTFERFLKSVTVDKNGNNALSKKFDSANVATYGLSAPDTGDAWGQTYWAGLANSNGFKYLDKNPWGTKYYYDSPALAQVFSWIAKGVKAGWIMDPRKTGGLGTTELWNAGKLVSSWKGSWEINDTLKVKNGDIKFATQPGAGAGPKTMFNGLADSINAKSTHQAEDLQWVLFLGSSACQDIVASKHVVFPAIKTATKKAFAAFAAAGVDIKGFTSVVDSAKTFIPPMAPNQAAVTAALKPYFEKIFYSQGDAQTLLTAANKAANAALQG